MYTISEDIKRYKPVLALNKILSRSLMSKLRTLFFVASLLCVMVSLVLFLFGHELTNLTLGIGLIFVGLWVEQILIYSYINSYYFYGLNSVVNLDEEKIIGTTYAVAEILTKNEKDVTKAFAMSELGTIVLLRAGVDPHILNAFFQTDRVLISTNMIPIKPDGLFSVISLGEYLLQQDHAFGEMLHGQGITDEIFFGALRWVVGTDIDDKKHERWWSKANLGKFQGLGREWSYGTAYLLQKYSRNIRTTAVFSTLTQKNTAFTEEKLSEIEVSFARSKASNVLLIGEAGVGTIDLLLEVDRRMKSGKSLVTVEDKQMTVLDTTRLLASTGNKQALELTLLAMLTEATKAGNIIIVIENLSVFIREAESLGVFIPELIDPFLASPDLHLAATDTPSNYHSFIKPHSGLSRRFSEIIIDEPDLSSTVKTLENITLQNEHRYQTLLTFEAVRVVAEAADRYLVEGAMPDKAIELLMEVLARASQEGLVVVNQDFVYKVVSDKTGIPVGPIGEAEKETLLNLEDKLHERVIGQRAALKAIASTMRRARAGVQTSNKPIGSFLFLGPSGVGKTETAKALAFEFFGSEDKMHRLDMSEFSGEGSLERLIGQRGTSGVLSDMLSMKPYAVLLLDEFEKSSQSVKDIFLQVLDEGFFTDSRGDKINARNTIIIATSNAGSELILRTIEQRQEVSSLNQEIVDYIIKQGIYRPELINRFDSTIIFEPLTLEEQGQVAGLMLKSLYKRIKSRGYNLSVTRDLIDILVKKGYNPQFGARPMKRVLQDVIEEKVAQKIISGDIKKGETLTLDKTDFTNEELT